MFVSKRQAKLGSQDVYVCISLSGLLVHNLKPSSPSQCLVLLASESEKQGNSLRSSWFVPILGNILPDQRARDRIAQMYSFKESPDTISLSITFWILIWLRYQRPQSLFFFNGSYNIMYWMEYCNIKNVQQMDNCNPTKMKQRCISNQGEYKWQKQMPLLEY